MSETSSPPTLFESFALLAQPVHSLSVASPSDIEAVQDDGESIRYKLREGASTTEIKIRPLTPAELEEAERILSAAGSPPRLTKKGSDGSLTPIGYDEEDPEYRLKLEPLLRKRQVYYALKGCPALYDSAPGGDIQAKIDSAMAKLPSALLGFIAQRVYNFSFPSGDLADFFTSGKSEGTPA